MKSFVIIFKSESTEDGSIFANLKDKGVETFLIPTLSFQFCNEHQLNSALIHPESYEGLIITSRHALESIENSLKAYDNWELWNMKLINEWNIKKNYSISPNTCELFKKNLKIEIPIRHQATNAKLLSALIVQENDNKLNNKPFLYLKSNVALETIDSQLLKNSIMVDIITTYNTIPNIEMEKFWNKETQSYIKTFDDYQMFLIFFSPSCILYSKSLWQKILKDFKNIKIVALGSRTKQSLLEHGFKPENILICEKPSANAAYHLIQEYIDK